MRWSLMALSERGESAFIDERPFNGIHNFLCAAVRYISASSDCQSLPDQARRQRKPDRLHNEIHSNGCDTSLLQYNIYSTSHLDPSDLHDSIYNERGLW